MNRETLRDLIIAAVVIACWYGAFTLLFKLLRGYGYEADGLAMGIAGLATLFAAVFACVRYVRAVPNPQASFSITLNTDLLRKVHAEEVERRKPKVAARKVEPGSNVVAFQKPEVDDEL